MTKRALGLTWTQPVYSTSAVIELYPDMRRGPCFIRNVVRVPSIVIQKESRFEEVELSTINRSRWSIQGVVVIDFSDGIKFMSFYAHCSIEFDIGKGKSWIPIILSLSSVDYLTLV